MRAGPTWGVPRSTFAKNRLDAALADANAAAEFGPNERDVYSIRAQIYRAMGRTSEANRDEVRKEQLSC